MQWWVPIVVALIGGPMMWGLHRLDKHNTAQHGENLHALRRIEGKMDKLDDRIHKHITWHAEREEEQ